MYTESFNLWILLQVLITVLPLDIKFVRRTFEVFKDRLKDYSNQNEKHYLDDF